MTPISPLDSDLQGYPSAVRHYPLHCMEFHCCPLLLLLLLTRKSHSFPLCSTALRPDVDVGGG